MCRDTPGQPPLPRVAVCACGAHFPECDTEDAIVHITTASSSAHYWVWLKEGWFFSSIRRKP